MENQSPAPLESPFPEASKSDTPEPPVFKPADEKKPKNKLIPLLIFLLIVALGVAGYFGWQNYQLRLEKEVADVQPESSPVVEVDETKEWELYKDSDYGFQLRYPESECDHLKDKLPVKQWNGEVKEDGYNLTASTDCPIGKGKYFYLDIRKIGTELELIDIWKKNQEEYGFVFSSCDENECSGIYPSSDKKISFRLKDFYIGERNGKSIELLDYDKTQGTPLTTQWIYFKLNPEYLIEINKGYSERTEKILSTFKFADGQVNETACKIDSDCMVKNVGSCCGYFPRCVNINFEPDLEKVKRRCEEMNVDSICGFRSVESCECENSKCSEIYK